MFFFFDIPEIKDNMDLTQLINPSHIQPDKYELVKQTQANRQEFKNMMNMEKVVKLIEYQDGLVNYQNIMENYLSKNVDMLQYLGYNQSSQQPNFEYDTFISQKNLKYETKSLTKPEAYAGELLMARYMYSFAYALDAFKYLKRVMDFQQNNLSHEQRIIDYDSMVAQTQKINEINDFNSNCDKALENLKIGYTKIFKVNNVINDLLYFLVQKQQQLIPELKATTLYSIKSLFETNANGIHIEKLINQAFTQKKSHETFLLVAQFAKQNVTNLNQIQSRFSEIKNEIKPEIFEYLNIALPFNKCIFSIAFSKCIDHTIFMENYPQGKNYTQVAVEQYVLAQEVLNCNNQILGTQVSQDLMHLKNYACLYLQKVFMPIANKIIAVRQSAVKQCPSYQNFEQQLSYLPAKDYFKDINPI